MDLSLFLTLEVNLLFFKNHEVINLLLNSLFHKPNAGSKIDQRYVEILFGGVVMLHSSSHLITKGDEVGYFVVIVEY